MIAFGLSMDAFAVSITNGMCCRVSALKNAFSSGMAFGLAQAAMPLIGYFAGHSFSSSLTGIDHWVALLLLGFIGGRMLWGAWRNALHPDSCVTTSFSWRMLWLQAVATSIDALAVGVSLGVMQVNIWMAASIIGATTFCCSFLGVLIGKRFGSFFQNKAEVLGGIILILIGVNIFWEHMGFGLR